ncbi:MAG: ferrous iron transport protein A [Candidatus Desulfofervidaceae bacterium]|nr:ferrous iron transport protein A [Candidatus Desulfofervidaceae bacterium]MDL1969990.1 ferrous iron transport protein A [Candidatus Desulfofervidaceae bacterium]
MAALTSLKKGQRALVKQVTGNGLIKQRLLKMGLVPGETVQIEKIAPLGSPIDVLVKGYHLSLRKEEANCVEVEVI